MNEIDLKGLPKPVCKMLTVDAARYIEGFQLAKARPPERVTLSAKQYKTLADALKKKGRTLENATFRGIPLVADGGDA